MHFITVIAFIASFSGSDCWNLGINWLWKSADVETDNKAIQYVDDVPLANVPYEAKTEDEKFLEAAKQYTDLQLSSLDTCQHKIVLHIRSSCSEMSEEEVGKMSVNLLNCLSSVEGRRLYPCSAEMSLKECTKDMDGDTWNAYHLMGNRARAVCYLIRQQQFRAQTDIAVNKLMQSAYSQLSTMEKLKEGQEKLGSFAETTLRSLSDGQESLFLQQEQMKNTQKHLRDFIGLNLRELTREKALIAAGHKELSKLTEDIKAKLDVASSQMEQQSLEQKDNHHHLVRDLTLVKEQVKIIWDEIELSTQKILSHHEMAKLKYEETLEKLTKINTTVSFLLNLMETMYSEFNDRLGWLSNVVGAAATIHGQYFPIIQECLLNKSNNHTLLFMKSLSLETASHFLTFKNQSIKFLEERCVLCNCNMIVGGSFVLPNENIVPMLTSIYTFFMHIFYLLMGMITTAYIQASSFTRLCLLIIIPLNLAVVYHQGADSALDYFSMTIIIVLSAVVHWFTVHLVLYANNKRTLKINNHYKNSDDSAKYIELEIISWWMLFKNKVLEYIDSFKTLCSKNETNSSQSVNIANQEYNGYESEDSRDESERSSSIYRFLHKKDFYPERQFQTFSRNSMSPDRKLYTSERNYNSPPTPPRSASSLSNRSGAHSGTPRMQCIATCRNGLFCRNSALTGSDYCHIHQNETRK